MPSFTFTSPEGKSYTVDGPEGATKEQAFGILQQQLAAGPVAPTDQSDPFRATQNAAGKIVKSAQDYLSDATGGIFSKGGLDNAIQHPGDAALKIAKESPFVNLPEAAVQGGSGMLSSIAGGLAGAARSGYGLVTGDGLDQAIQRGADLSNKIQQSATYQPQSAGGKVISEAATLPMTAVSQGSRYVLGNAARLDAEVAKRGADFIDPNHVVLPNINPQNWQAAGEEFGGAVPAIAGTLAGAGAFRGKPSAAPSVAVDMPPVDLIRSASTETPQSAVRPRYDPSGNRIVYPDPTPTPNLYNLLKQSIGGGLSPEDQTSRMQTLQRIGMDEARQSAIAGDSAEGAMQAQVAKFTDTPAGLAANDLLNSERQALTDHANGIVTDTGAARGALDSDTLHARGQIIATPLDGLRKYFNSAIKKLYQAADEQSGGKPMTQLNELDDLVNTEHNFSGKTANQSIGNGLRDYLKKPDGKNTTNPIMNQDGTLNPVTPMQAEGIKQYLNSNWSNETSGLIGKIKAAIDNDVLKGAGGDIYANARNLFRKMKETLDNPEGIQKITEFDTQTPINRTTAFEKVPDTLIRLDVDQFGHVIDTLKKIIDPKFDTPELLQQQAYDALAEIRGHFANKILKAGSENKGQWNAGNVTEFLQNNNKKMQMVFDNDTLKKIADLNDAGHILSVDKSYPGAAAQAALAVKRGLMPSIISKVMTGAGGLIGAYGGPIIAGAGAGAGAAAGDAIAANIGNRAALNNFNRGVVNIQRPPAPIPPPRLPISRHPTAEAVAALSANNAEKQQAINNIGGAQTVDQAIAAANKAVGIISTHWGH